jgi:quercetin dioxygenase-like cupin family protein
LSHHDTGGTRDLSHLTKIDVVDVRAAVEADKLTADDVFKRTYLGHGTQSSVFVFQGHAGPFRKHVHVDHDEIGYVLEGTGSVTVGGVTRPVKKGDVWVIPANTPHGGQFEDAPQVLFISSPIDDPDNQDRIWLDE